MSTLRSLQKKVAGVNRDRGWYDVPRTFAECIALIHSEVSEALEAYRKAETPEQMQQEIGEELADVVIRCLDTAERQGVDLQACVDQKILKNMKREYRHGGRRL